MVRLAALMLVALLAQKAPAQQTLADRVPLPDGYASEQDTQTDGAYDFASVPGVRGHILRRYVQAGDDKTSPPDIAAFFAAFVHSQRGIVFGDRVNNLASRLDGRIPGDKPLWLHIEVSDEGGVIDVLVLEERQPIARELPVEEQNVEGTWTSDLPIGVRLSPSLKPYRGWAWSLVADGDSRAKLLAAQRTQACGSCPIVTDKTPVTIATFSIDMKSPPDIPSRHGAGEVSLYQNQLIDTILATIR